MARTNTPTHSGEDVRYFVLHVPKCAGGTIIRHLDRHLGDRAMDAPRQEGLARDLFGNRYPFEAGDPRLRDVVVFHGHALSESLKALLPGASIRESVLLRDPVGWFVSMYNFRVARQRAGIGPVVAPFEQWYRAERRNPITRFLLYRYFGEGVPWLYRLSSRAQLRVLERKLARFWFVGAYRDVDELTGRIAAELGIPGSPERRNTDSVRAVTVDGLPDGLRARIVAENPVDALLYARWKERKFDASANPPPLERELPDADQPRILLREAELGLRKAWLRHVLGYNRKPKGAETE